MSRVKVSCSTLPAALKALSPSLVASATSIVNVWVPSGSTEKIKMFGFDLLCKPSHGQAKILTHSAHFPVAHCHLRLTTESDRFCRTSDSVTLCVALNGRHLRQRRLRGPTRGRSWVISCPFAAITT